MSLCGSGGVRVVVFVGSGNARYALPIVWRHLEFTPVRGAVLTIAPGGRLEPKRRRGVS